MKFQINDWVRYKYDNGNTIVFKITSMGEESEYSNPNDIFEVLYDGEWDYRNDEACSYRKEFCFPWTPEKGDLCWFWNETNNEVNPQLRKFKSLDNNGRFMPDKSVMGFKKCEPFKGELPICLEYLLDED